MQIKKPKELAAAMLYQAFLDVYSRSQITRYEARQWISDGDIGAISFNLCCAVLDFDHNEIRAVVWDRLKHNKAVLAHIRGGSNRMELRGYNDTIDYS